MATPHERPEIDLRSCASEEIYAALPSAGLEEVDALFANPAFTEAHVLAWLRQAHLPAEVIERISAEERFIKRYPIKAGIANHPATPRILAQTLLRFLFWRDLMRVAENARVHPQIRRIAEGLLQEAAETLTLGEKIALARAAGRAVLRVLRTETDEKVMEALLQNPRLTEEDALLVAGRPATPAPILGLIGRSSRWASRYSVRLAIIRNPSTPLPVALGILSSLLARDLQGVADTPGLQPLLREGARNVLEKLKAKKR